MGRQLTQQEIDAAFSGKGAAGNRRVVKPFDLTRLDRIPKAQIRALHQLHDGFIRSFSANLAAYLRTHVRMNLVSVEQISYGEFLEGLSSPTFISYLGLSPYDGMAVMEINQRMVFTILETLLGGTGGGAPARPVTEVEQELMQDVLRTLLRGLREAWASVAAVSFDVQMLAHEPDVVHVMPPSEPVVAIGIETQVGDAVEMINFALPALFIKQLRYLFDRLRFVQQTQSKPKDRAQMAELLRAVDLEVEVRLEGSKLPAYQLAALKPGDVLQLDYPVTRKATAHVNGRARFWGTLTQTGPNLVYQIADEVTD